jgi:hypothetical protein
VGPGRRNYSQRRRLQRLWRKGNVVITMIIIMMKKLKPSIWRSKCGTSFTILGFGGAHLKEVHDGCCKTGVWYKIRGLEIVLWWW